MGDRGGGRAKGRGEKVVFGEIINHGFTWIFTDFLINIHKASIYKDL